MGVLEIGRVFEAVEGYVGCADKGTDAGVEEVAEHEEVGCEEEECEEKPAVVEVLVGEEGEEESGFFDAEEGGGAGEHAGLYEVVEEMVPR